MPRSVQNLILSTLALLSLIGVAGCTPPSQGDVVSDCMERSERLLKLGHKDLAIAEIDRSVANTPSNLYVYEAAYETLRRHGSPREGLRYLERASRIRHSDSKEMKSDFSTMFRMMGDEYLSEKRMEDAEKAYTEAIRLDSTNCGAYNDFGYMYAEAGVKLDEAVRLTQRAVDLKPDTGEFQDSLGWALYRKGDNKKSLEALRKAVEISPNQADIRYHLGMAEERAGDTKSAVVEYRKALLVCSQYKQAADRLRVIR